MAGKNAGSILITIFLFALVLSPILPCDATRPIDHLGPVVKRVILCPDCVCCTPPAPGSCCKCCASPIHTQSPSTP
ncbi:Cell division cycle protein-like protein [Corchorus olitorius]|uniref:Cell division cycle protein-like protein n=1 Tax=Corchorus olitorius TaxID=93759 RepID=A0A1R3H823_9ROSI|nr:Cell division cycle protein-like protein [Corchorus olitorius]